MIKAKIQKEGSSILRVFINNFDAPIKSGIIKLKLVVDRKNSTVVAEQPFDFLTLVYDFNLSGNSPYNIGDYDYIVEIDDGEQQDYSRPIKLFGGAPVYIRGAIKKIRDDFRRVAKSLNGSVVYLFKRIPGSQKCEACWDEDLQSSNNTNCKVCGGTGFISYYSNPFKTYAGPLNFANETFSTEDAGKVLQTPSVTLSVIADFILIENDIIFYAKTGDWYRVKARTVSELQTYPVLQNFIAAVMPSGSPEVEQASKILQGFKK